MNIALINPLIKTVPNFGLMYIASYLESNGHSIKIIEMLDYKSYLRNNKEKLDEIIKSRFDLIGISCMSFDYGYAVEIIKYLKENKCDTPLILGGRYPSFFYEECLKDRANFVCVGEGEELMLKLIEEFKKTKPDLRNIKGLAYRENGMINFNGYPVDFVDLDTLPMPAYHLIDYNAYTNIPTYGIKGRYIKTGWIFTSRGCIGRCIFCYDPLFQKRIRFREISYVIDEIKYQIKKYNIKGLMIFDDVFNINENRIVEFCEKILTENIKIEMMCAARADTFNRNMARYMRKAGFVQVGIGIESGSQKVLDYLRKGTTIEQIEETVKICREYGLKVDTNIMLGTPCEDETDIAKTTGLLKKLKLDITGVTFLTPYPGTQLYEMALKNKWIDGKLRYFAHGDEEPTLAVNFSKEELKRFRDEVYNAVFLKIYKNLLLSLKFLCDMSKIIINRPQVMPRLFKIWKYGTRNQLIKYIVRQLYISNFKLKKEDGFDK